MTSTSTRRTRAGRSRCPSKRRTGARRRRTAAPPLDADPRATTNDERRPLTDPPTPTHPHLDERRRVREKLGLKPLREGVSDRERARRDDEEAALQIRREREAEKETEAVRERIATAKERRLMDQRNKATKQLGDAPDEEDDDLASWVNKSRAIEEKKRAEDRAKAEALAKKLAEQDDDAEDLEDDEDLGEDGPNSFGANKSKSSAYTAKDLAGMKVGHGVDEVREGETVVMTLKDASILDERRSAINDETDELENVLLAENKRR